MQILIGSVKVADVSSAAVGPHFLVVQILIGSVKVDYVSSAAVLTF